MNAPWPPSCEHGDDRVGDRPAADQPRLVVAELGQQRLLLRRLDEPHRAPLEAERGELLVGQFEEDVDQGVAQAADVELFGHCDSLRREEFAENAERMPGRRTTIRPY